MVAPRRARAAAPIPAPDRHLLRGIVEARALVTRRMRPLLINGKMVHQVGVPYHWGYRGLVKGDSANDLVAISEEPNVRIMEAKEILSDVSPGRRARGKAALDQCNAQLRRHLCR